MRVGRLFNAAVLLGLGALGAVAPLGSHAHWAAPISGFDLQGAIAQAAEGDLIMVPAGVYAGPILIDRSVRVIGSAGAVIDAEGRGDAVRITAPDVVLRGFEIRRTGASVDRENSGIAVSAPRVVIEDNILTDVLFGIMLTEAPGSVVRRNRITGKDLDLGRRGDAIRLWQSAGTLVESNTVRCARDVVVWYSSGAVLRDNSVRDGRYGLHSMYTDGCVMDDNRLEGNSVGIFMMYSRNLQARRNVIVDNRGPSGFGVGLKDVDGVVMEDNVIAGNRVGINLDTSPTRADIHHHHRRNVLAYNDVAVGFMPAVQNNHFQDNVFVENIENIAILGGGAFEGQNSFTVDGRGNYWGDYRGFDLDGDGVGDIEYRAEGLFENLIDREPKLRYFLYSPAQQAIDMAARSFPVVTPRPKVVDSAPWTRPPISPRWPVARENTSGGRSTRFGLVALALSGLGGAGVVGAGAALGSRPRAGSKG